MYNYQQPLLLDDERGTENRGAYIASLRFFLRMLNLVLALVGVAMILYAVHMYLSVSKQAGIRGFPWFIFAFGAAGAAILLTASSALWGVAHNSQCCLGLYSGLTFFLLLVQAALAVAFFADDKSWRKLLPHDDTGEAERLDKFLKRKLEIVRWVGLAALIIQVLGVALAHALSNAQLKLLEDSSYVEEEGWGRREAPTRPLAGSTSAGPRSPLPGSAAPRTDPWSQRMQSKYGLDVNDFSYSPTAATQQGRS